MDLSSAVRAVARGSASSAVSAIASGSASSAEPDNPADSSRAAFLRSIRKRQLSEASSSGRTAGQRNVGFTFSGLRQVQSTLTLCCELQEKLFLSVCADCMNLPNAVLIPISY